MEELKLVMETIKGLGGDTKEMFIWWLVVRYALRYFFITVFTGTIIYTLLKLVVPGLKQSAFEDEMQEVMGFVGVFTRSEKDKIINKLKGE